MGVNELFDLAGRTAVVTGGSRGLGLQIAEALGEQGARLVLTARKRDQLGQAAQTLRAEGIEVMVVPCDLSHGEGVDAFVSGVLDRHDTVDILVNNAGATWRAPAEEHPMDAWHKVIDLNLTATFQLTQRIAAATMLPRGRGRIINVASVAGMRGNHPDMMGTIAYNTSKGGVITMTRALAVEWARHGVTVNAIAPGYFPTKMTRGTLEYAKDLIEQITPLGRVGGPEDLKGVAVLLASDASAYITGQTIAVDGGLTAR
ncbi:MAG: SDR family oxidoreductase [Actinobacteria bacterium]|nr:SDR family oxidoreductase [Actinomycetota bacterium]